MRYPELTAFTYYDEVCCRNHAVEVHFSGDDKHMVRDRLVKLWNMTKDIPDGQLEGFIDGANCYLAGQKAFKDKIDNGHGGNNNKL